MSDDQLDFSEIQPTHDVDTSREMARLILPKMTEKRLEILHWFSRHKDGNANEILLDLRKDTPNQVSPIVTWLHKRGLILWLGITRPTQFDRPARVYTMTERGWQALRAASG